MKKYPLLLTFTLVVLSIWYTFYSSMPQQITNLETPPQEFSTLRALEHVKKIAAHPHYLGSPKHKETQIYIVNELKKLGLQPEIQEGFTVYTSGECSRPQNIIAKIKGSGNGKALLLLTHYDSDPHSSYGASDAASGVATILESLRAYISTNKIPKNDIILCFTDGEELGLNGANLFVSKHPWAKNIGLALNFEARGSGGNAYMLMETNGKNSKMIDAFSKADPKYPMTNSLAYSIYKMLPNDTDLTVFRELGDINGFNFAFIDDHYDYHTANDTWQNLDLNTLQHQGSYLMPLLSYFSETNLSDLKSGEDYVYFNAPIFSIIKYPYSWIYGLLILAILLFVVILFYGRINYRISAKEIVKGFGALLVSLVLSGGLSYGGWAFLKVIYPQYTEIQQGFTYNGYLYIVVFTLLSLGICFKVYHRIHKKENQASLMVASLSIWIIISFITAIYLKGASYFILLVFFGLLSLFVLIRQKQPNAVTMVLLAFPAIYIITPFIANFPVALGLKLLFVSALLLVLLFALLIPAFGFYERKKRLGNLSFLFAFIFLIAAHLKSDFTEERPKPNSLVYLLDTEQNKAVWATYDDILDSWTENYINPKENIAESQYSQSNIKQSIYNKGFSFASQAPMKEIRHPKIEISEDTIIGGNRHVNVCIVPQRAVNRIDLYTASIFDFQSISINGETAMDYTARDGNTYNVFTKRRSKSLLSYYVNKNEPLELRMVFHKDTIPDLIMYESSYDLLKNDLFTVPERNKNMIPKPFVLNDAIILKKRFSLVYVEKETDSITTENTVKEILIN